MFFKNFNFFDNRSFLTSLISFFASNNSETFETIGSIILIFPYLLALRIAEICLLKIFGKARVSLIALSPKAGFGDLVKYLSIEGTFLSLPTSNVLIVRGFPFRYFKVFLKNRTARFLKASFFYS